MPPEEKMKISSWKQEARGIVRTLLVALAVVLPIRLFIAQPFIVRGASMEPNFKDGEYLVVDELSYRFREPERGDVIIFRYPNDPAQFFIKRIVGLPGETVVIKSGYVYIRNEKGEDIKLEETYLSPKALTVSNEVVLLGHTDYFVLGDNRPASSDSRVWGTLDERYLVGRAFLRLFPPGRLAVL